MRTIQKTQLFLRNSTFLFLTVFISSTAFSQVQNFGNLKMHSNSQLGLFTDFTNNGVFTNNTGTLYVVGSALQTFDGTGLIHAQNMVIDNSSNLQLNNVFEIESTLTFSSGMILGDRGDAATEFVHFLAGSSYSGTTDARYINGVVRKTGNTAFTFPIGDATNLQTLAISAPDVISDHFSAYYTENSGTVDGFDTESLGIGVHHVSKCEWWQLDRTGGSSAVNLSLCFNSNSCGVTTLPDLIVAHWNGSGWESMGTGGTTGTTSEGTISTLGLVNDFSPFTLGSSTSNNPLPIELVLFTANAIENTVHLNWQTATEINNDYFTIQRSKNGIDWEAFHKVSGAGNSSSLLNYIATDNQPYSGISYYRLKQTDFDGQQSFSEIRSIEINELESELVELHPNPTSKYVVLKGSSSELANVTVYTSVGQNITLLTPKALTNETSLRIDLSRLSHGIYYVKTKTTAYKVYKR